MIKGFNNFKLFEGIEDTKKYFKGKIKRLTINDDKLLIRLIKMDPTSNLDKDYVGKYSKWLITLFTKNDSEVLKVLDKKNGEDDYKIKTLLKVFHNNKNKVENKNIYNYKLFNDFENDMNMFNSNISYDDLKGEFKEDVLNGDIQLFAETDKWRIVVPNNKPISCKYGKGSNWCTADSTYNAFDTYNKKGKLYIFLDKEDDMKPKYQFHFETSTYMDLRDRPIKILDFFEKYENVYDKFFPDVKNKLKNKKQLTAKEFKVLPSKYVNQYLEYFESKLLSAFENPELFKKHPELIGFEKYEHHIGHTKLQIDMPLSDFAEELDVEEYNINRVYAHGSEISNSDMYYYDEEAQYVLTSLLDEKTQALIKKISHLLNIKIDIDKDNDEEDNLKEWQKIVKILDLSQLDSLYYFPQESHQEAYSDLMESKLNDILFVFDDDDISINYNDAKVHLIQNNLAHLGSIEEIFDELDSEFEDLFSESNYEFLYEVSWDRNYIYPKFVEELEEIIEKIIDGDYDLDYDDDNIEIYSKLEEFGFEIDKTYTKDNVRIKITNETKGDKIKIEVWEIDNHTSEKFFVKPDEIESYFHYFQQLKLPFKENKINRFDSFKKNFEACDSIKVKDKVITFYNNNVYPFFIMPNNKVKIGPEKETHGLSGIKGDKLRGRIYFDYKVIGFWSLDRNWNESYEKLFKILGKKFKIDDWSEWRIDILIWDDLEVFKDKGYEIYVPDYNDDEYALVPVNDFINGNYNIADDSEQYKIHLLNSVDKSKRLKELGYKPKVKKWKDWQKPFEAADSIPNVDWETKKAFPFFISYATENFDGRLDYEIFVGDEGLSHSEIDNDFDPSKESDLNFRYKIKGRIFEIQKIIGFWDLEIWTDDYDNLFDVVAKEFRINNWADWRIDLSIDNDEDKETYVEKGYEIYNPKYYNTEYVLIPVYDFLSGDFNVPNDSEQYQLHLMKAPEKAKRLKELGYKSKVSKWKKWQKPFESILIKRAEVDKILDKISKLGMNKLSTIELLRMKLFSEDDKDIIETIDKMGDITLKFKELNKEMKRLSDEGKDAKPLMTKWLSYNNQMRKLETEIEVYNISLGDENLRKLMKKIRPDVY